MDPASDLRNGAHLPAMSKESRGADIVRRREALGYDNPHKFAKATGRDYDTIKRAEEGGSSDQTYDWLEAWLDRTEGGGEPPPGQVKLELRGFYSRGGTKIDEIIASGGDPDELAEMLGKLVDRLGREDEQDGPK